MSRRRWPIARGSWARCCAPQASRRTPRLSRSPMPAMTFRRLHRTKRCRPRCVAGRHGERPRRQDDHVLRHAARRHRHALQQPQCFRIDRDAGAASGDLIFHGPLGGKPRIGDGGRWDAAIALAAGGQALFFDALAPDLGEVFMIQVPNAPFGPSWYQTRSSSTRPAPRRRCRCITAPVPTARSARRPYRGRRSCRHQVQLVGQCGGGRLPGRRDRQRGVGDCDRRSDEG